MASSLAGTADRMEAAGPKTWRIEIDFIRISGLRGKGIKALIAAPLRILNAWRQAQAIIKHTNLTSISVWAAMFRVGGGLAAWSLGIPVVLHEDKRYCGLNQ
ncbi:glycosyltransferase [Shigella flexneri]